MTFGFREWEREWQIPFPNFGNGIASENFHPQFFETGTEMKTPFPIFGNGNGMLVFSGMTGNDGN